MNDQVTEPVGDAAEVAAEKERFHQLFGQRRTRAVYRAGDFFDYLLMTMACAAVIWWVYEALPVLRFIGLALCAYVALAFVWRHGVALRWPLLLRRPQELVYLLLYKLTNIKPWYLVALALIVAESLLVSFTPELPHHTERLRQIAGYLFLLHLFLLTSYRTVILVAHLRKADHVERVLAETAWKRFTAGRPIRLEIMHAYFTGLLAHVLLVAPWFLVLSLANYSLIFAPVFLAANVVVHLSFMKSYGDWFYRDHWLGHNSELDFLYLHGPHHDAIPSGLIGVSGNGFLEGTLRHTFGNPTAFYNPLLAFLLHSVEVQQDIEKHQFIPGVYPRLPRSFHESAQHSVHHYGSLEPYSIGLREEAPAEAEEGLFTLFPRALTNSIEVDERLNGYRWDNPKYRRFMDLYDRYEQ